MTTTIVKERPINLRDWEVRAILDGTKSQMRRVVRPQPDHFHRDIVGKEKTYATEDWNRIIPQLGDDEIPCPYGALGDQLWVREAWRLDDHDFAMAKNRECPSAWLLSGRATENGLAANCWWARPPADQRMALAKRWGTASARKKEERGDFYRWRFSSQMPRWASRITLEVVSVRVERVQDISNNDAIACGATPMGYANQWGKQIGWNCDWSRVGNLSKWASGARRDHRNQKAPLTVSDVALGSARMAFANMWDADNAKRGDAWKANLWVWVVGFRRVAT